MKNLIVKIVSIDNKSMKNYPACKELIPNCEKLASEILLSYTAGIFFAILGRGPRAFQIGKISAVNHYFGKFAKQTRTAFLVSLKTKLAITHTIAIKLKENRRQF